MNVRKKLWLLCIGVGLLLAAAAPALAQDAVPEPDGPRLILRRGEVIAVTSHGFVIKTADENVRLIVGERPRFQIPGVEEPTLADLAVGDACAVAALPRADGRLFAVRVTVLPPRLRLDGDIVQIDGTDITIQNPGRQVLIHVDAQTRLRVPGVDEPTLSDLKAGDHIHGFAVEHADGSLWGRLLMVVDEYKLRGVVASIKGNAITVEQIGETLTVVSDEHTRFRVPGVESPTLADVQVGDLVGLLAFGRPDGTILAKAVNVLRGITVRGEVTSNDNATLTIATVKGSLVLVTDADTLYDVPGVENPSLSDLQLGDRVAVLVVPHGSDTTLLAKRIAVLRVTPKPI